MKTKILLAAALAALSTQAHAKQSVFTKLRDELKDVSTMAGLKEVLLKSSKLKGAVNSATTTKYIFESGLFNQMFAKETCTCMYLDHQTLASCQANDNLPGIAHQVVSITAPVSPEDPDTSKPRVVSAKFNLLTRATIGAVINLGPSASAHFVSDKFGCVMDTPAPPEH